MRQPLDVRVFEYPMHIQNALAIHGKSVEHDSALDTLEVTSAMTVQVVAAVNLTAGQPVYVDGVSGQLKLANASAFASSSAIGLAQSTIMATYVANVALFALTLADWTAVIGTATLTKGARYFLGLTAGTLSTVAPSTPGQSIASIGVAISTIQLRILPQEPILL